MHDGRRGYYLGRVSFMINFNREQTVFSNSKNILIVKMSMAKIVYRLFDGIYR